MERKTYLKSAPPSTIISSSSTKGALKSKAAASQKLPAKAKLDAPGNTNSQPEEVDLLKKAAAKVTQLTKTRIPEIPHILSVPEHRTRYSLDESSHPLFTREEFSALQYMTHLEETDRGILLVESSSVVEDKGISPASSGGKDPRTPNGDVDAKKPEFKKKIKFGDYAKVGKIGTTRPNTAAVMEHKLPPKPAVVATAVHGRGGSISAKSPNDAGSEPGVTAHSKSQVETALSTNKHSTTHADSASSKATKPTQNGAHLHPHPSNPASRSPALSNGTSHNTNAADASSQKGSLKRCSPYHESAPPAKKAKVSESIPTSKTTISGGPIANGQARRQLANDEPPTSATKKAKLPNGVQSKVETLKNVTQASHENVSSQDSRKKESPVKNKQEASSESSAKKAPASKPGNLEQSKSISRGASKPALPPLLSPTLPPQVIAANSFIEPANLKPSGKATNSAESKSPKPSGSKAINSAKSPKPVLEKSGMSKAGAETNSRTLLPSLLSPGLPPEVEAALAARNKGREASKDLSFNEKHVVPPKKQIDTVAERHEKSRQPNAPGTARKVVKNAKNREEANSTITDAAASSSAPAENSLLIKLKYKKKQKKDVERILKLRPDRAAYDHLTTDNSNKDGPEGIKASDRPASRDERRNSIDRPRHNDRAGASKVPASSSVAQKRPRAEEPTSMTNKRLKPSDQPQPSKPSTPTTPAIKPPATSTPSSAQKTLINTPKKGDSLKASAMMRVTSTDGAARTPQAIQPSLPGSAEKASALPSATNNGHRESANPSVVELSNLAMKLKREFDRLHQTKAGGLSSITLADRKLGLVVGLESILSFLAQFDALEAVGRGNVGNWEGTLKLHGWFDQVIQDMPILEVLSLQIKILCRFKIGNTYASHNFSGINLQKATDNLQKAADNTIQQAKLWKELDHKMSNEFVQKVEESTSRNKKGFNPAASTRHFIATSLRKLKRFADTESIPWEQQLKISD